MTYLLTMAKSQLTIAQTLAKKHSNIIVFVLTTICVSYAMVSMYQLFMEQRAGFNKSIDEAQKNIQSIHNDIALLKNYKHKFVASLRSIEQWMAEAQPLINNDGLAAASQAQADMLTFLNDEMKKIEERFNTLPTINDVEKVNQRIASLFDALPKNQSTILAQSHHGKVLCKSYQA